MILFIRQTGHFKKIMRIISILSVLFIIIGCSSDKILNTNRQTNQKVVFDIPFLLNKNANQIKEILGKPSFDGKSFGDPYRGLGWVKNNYKFVFDLNPDGSIRKKTFILNGFVKYKATVDSTLEAGNLDIKSKRYKIIIGNDGTRLGIINIIIISNE